jgi:hypothetical protein
MFLTDYNAILSRQLLGNLLIPELGVTQKTFGVGFRNLAAHHQHQL